MELQVVVEPSHAPAYMVLVGMLTLSQNRLLLGMLQMSVVLVLLRQLI
jgi:hypothetical protein